MSEERVLAFAREELSRYAARMDPGYPAEQIKLIPFSGPQRSAECIRDSHWDDAYRIEISAGSGTIAYSNARSALLGVYRLLCEAGCAFLRPGPEGEFVPRRSLGTLDVHVAMRAAYRHRCICIEGSVSLENVLDIIDFAPKAGYNAYFTQFMESYTFFERWYTHKGNPLRTHERFSPSLAREMQACIVDAIQRRGLLYHAVGHGWTCVPLGIPGLHWEDDGIEPTPAQQACMAEINGVRGLHNGIALNTNLWPTMVRTLMARAVARYAADDPRSRLHVWLDDFNNQCECSAVKKRRLDFYSMLLNEIDELSHNRGAPYTLHFCCTSTCSFRRVRLHNEERFILMYAPIRAAFRAPLQAFHLFPHPRYRRNHPSSSDNLSENLGFLSAWQTVFHGDSFDFDYHLCGVVNSDPGQMTIARVLYNDIRALHALGLNGLVNCRSSASACLTALRCSSPGRRSVIRRSIMNTSAEFTSRSVSGQTLNKPLNSAKH